MASENNYLKIVPLLLQMGADPFVKDVSFDVFFLRWREECKREFLVQEKLHKQLFVNLGDFLSKEKEWNEWTILSQ